MSAKQDRLIAEQQTYLDMVTASEPYRRITVYDRMNARDSRTRFKIAAGLYPCFKWVWVTRNRAGEWIQKVYVPK